MPIIRTIFVALALPIAWGLCAALATGDDLRPAVEASRPLLPAESAEQFQLSPGFRIELVAAEPLLADPVAIAFDARGRLLVCEIHGYNLEGYLDVVELNKSGVLDREVRRVPAADEAIAQAEQQQYGTVKRLEDTDGDGRLDRAHVLADRLPPCYGLVPACDGVIVFCAPHILYLADRDDDGHAEVREKLFTGFGVGELWTRINNPRYSVDNWIYGVCGGGSAGTIHGPRLDAPVELGSVCFRFKADGSALRPASGRTSGFGQAVDAWGDRFLCTNQQHALFVAPLPHEALARNPFYAAPNPTINICQYGHPARVYPTSKPDPWRSARAADPRWVRFYGAAEATANGFFTAASGPVIYTAEAFPPEFRGNHFSVDNAQNLIHRCRLEPHEGGYTAVRGGGDPPREFLTSRERWFRPVNLTVGPDGALYVVDMYRDIIEDYSAIPRYLQQQYVESLIAGADRGRIWRIVADGAPPLRPFDLDRAAPADLVARLSDGNLWWRITAQRLLIERDARAAVPQLTALVRGGASPAGRLHALCALDGLGTLAPDVLADALGDDHFAVRMHAVRLSESRIGDDAALAAQVAALVDDPHPRVRLQLALSLGALDEPRRVDALAKLADRHGDQQWMPAAILSSATESCDALLIDILDRGADGPAASLLKPLAATVGARRRDAELGGVLNRLAEPPATVDMKVRCLEGLVDGLARGEAQPLRSQPVADGAAQLLADDDPQVRRLALRVAGLLRLHETPRMRAAYADAAAVAIDQDRPTPDRLAAIGLLTGAPVGQWESAAAQLLDARQTLAVQLAVVAALGAAERDDRRVAELLLEGFYRSTPKLQAATLDAVFGRLGRLPALLDALEDETIPISSLDTTRREQLMRSADVEVARRAKALLADSSSSQQRGEVLERYRASLQLERDVERGRAVFERQCAKCHKLAGKGYEVGPDLSAVKTRPDETLLRDVIDPSNQLTVGYQSYTVLTRRGRIFTGVLVAETATSITLRREEGKDETVLRREIDEMEASPLSMMPEDVEKEVTVQDVADLLGYLRHTLGAVDGDIVTLLDDDPAVIDLLDEGEGRLRMERLDTLVGGAALAVTPPQRFSAQIPGWQYRIAEQPGPGEFRFLRFAWKQPTGDGVMLELAGEGTWPPADRPKWRYVAGKNTTTWQAVRVADEAPTQWVVVTRDLWKDFGPFTLTGMAPTAMGGEALFDRIELLRSIEK